MRWACDLGATLGTLGNCGKGREPMIHTWAFDILSVEAGFLRQLPSKQGSEGDSNLSSIIQLVPVQPMFGGWGWS